MSMELKQSSKAATVGAASFDDDKSGNRALYMDSGSRVKTTWLGVITATSPGTLQGLGGDGTAYLPSGAVPTRVQLYATNPGSTGGTVTVGLDTTSTYFLNAVAVATLAQSLQQSPQAVTNLFTPVATLPVGQAHTLTGFFTQTATSTAAGPFYVAIDFYVPDPA